MLCDMTNAECSEYLFPRLLDLGLGTYTSVLGG